MDRIPAKVTVRRRSTRDFVTEKTLLIDPEDREDLDGILLRAVREDGWDADRVSEFILEIDPEGGGKRIIHPPEGDRNASAA